MSNRLPAGSLALIVLAFMLGTTVSANATVIYNALGGAENGGDPLSAGPILADRFVVKANSFLSSVSLNLAATGTAGSFEVALFADHGTAAPTLAAKLATGTDASLTSAFKVVTYTPSMLQNLVAGASYYIGIMDLGGSTTMLGNTLDGKVLGRPNVKAGGYYYNNGGVQANAGGPYEISLSSTAVPEAASFAPLMGGLAMLGLGLRRRARRAA